MDPNILTQYREVILILRKNYFWKKSMHEISKFIFWTTILLYAATLFFASYVGVYLTYVAIPVIILFGLIMKFTKPKTENPNSFNSAINEFGKATTSTLDEVNSFLIGINSSLEQHNKKHELIKERTRTTKELLAQSELKKLEYELGAIKAETDKERDDYRTLIESTKKTINKLQDSIRLIEKECEVEVALIQAKNASSLTKSNS